MTEVIQRKPGTLALGGVRETYGVPPLHLRDPAAPWWRIVDAVLAVSILAGVVIAGNLDGGRMPGGLPEFLAIRITVINVLLLTGFGLIWPAVLSACGLYSPPRLRTGSDEWPRLLLASAIGGVVAMGFSLTSKTGAVRPEHAAIFATAILLSTALLRKVVRAGERAQRGGCHKQILIVGSGPMAARIHGELQSDPLGVNEVIGFVDSEPHTALGAGASIHLGGMAELERILMHQVVDDVFIGLPIKSRYDDIQQALAACARVGVPARYPADLFGPLLDPRVAHNGVVSPILSIPVAPEDPQLLIKRGLDVVVAALLLVLLSPIMLGVALLIKLTSPGPVLFVQERYGHVKRRFRMYKFRTMVVDAEVLQAALEDQNEAAGPIFKIREDPRFTITGRFLRRTSLDELPQLWHVLTGEMSLVGPRPMAVRDVSRFAEPWLMKRFSVKPGLTCLWQIKGRSNLGFDQWINLDLEYIDRWSLWLDLKILLLTIPAVASGRGAA